MPLANILQLVVALIETSSHLPAVQSFYQSVHAELVKVMGEQGADITGDVLADLVAKGAAASQQTVQPIGAAHAS